MELTSKILLAAEKMFMKYGIKSITMDDISRELGISKKTIYQFFENKKGLIRKVIFEHNRREKDAIKEIQSQALYAIDEMAQITRHILQEVREMTPTVVYDLKKYHKESWSLVESLHSEFVFGVIRDNIVHGIDEGLYRKSIVPEVLAQLYVHISLILVDQETFSSIELNQEDRFKQFLNYHLQGILSDKGRKVFMKYVGNEL